MVPAYENRVRLVREVDDVRTAERLSVRIAQRGAPHDVAVGRRSALGRIGADGRGITEKGEGRLALSNFFGITFCIGRQLAFDTPDGGEACEDEERGGTGDELGVE